MQFFFLGGFKITILNLNLVFEGSVFAIFCFLAPIVGIGGSIYGFASGKKDMGIGFLVGTALLPFASFALILFLW